MELAFQVQTVQSNMAGYMGGYTCKAQETGKRELDALRESFDQSKCSKLAGTNDENFKEASRRLLRDLEGKGIIRTAIEIVNLTVNNNEMDSLAAECIRSFPTVNFPAKELLKREEIETGKIAGAQSISHVVKPRTVT
jgi:hypothetical protein